VPLAHATRRDTALTPRKLSVEFENWTRGADPPGTDCPTAEATIRIISGRQRMWKLSQNPLQGKSKKNSRPPCLRQQTPLQF